MVDKLESEFLLCDCQAEVCIDIQVWKVKTAYEGTKMF